MSMTILAVIHFEDTAATAATQFNTADYQNGLNPKNT